jgi:hypothetical protein
VKRRGRDEWEDFDDVFGNEDMSRVERKLLLSAEGDVFDDEERRRGFGERLGGLLFPAGLVERSLTAVAMAAGAALVVNYLLLPGVGIASRAAKLFVPAPVASTIEAATDQAGIGGSSYLDVLLSDGDSNRRSIPEGSVAGETGSIDIPVEFSEPQLVKLVTGAYAPGDRAQRLLTVTPPGDLVRPWSLHLDPTATNTTGVFPPQQDVVTYMYFAAEVCDVPWTQVSVSPPRYTCDKRVVASTGALPFSSPRLTLLSDITFPQGKPAPIYLRVWVTWPDSGAALPASVSGQQASLSVDVSASIKSDVLRGRPQSETP